MGYKKIKIFINNKLTSHSKFLKTSKMKKILTLLCVLVLTQMANGQYWQIPNPGANANPGTLNPDPEYPLGGGLATGWATALGPSNASPTWSANQTIPFSFSFNGTPVTQFKVSSSGILTFDVATALAAPSYSRAALPNATIPDNSVCIWGLGGIGTNDNVVTKMFGTAPNRQFWIQFSSYGYGSVVSDGSNFTYWSIVLEETTNRIHIVDNRTGGYTGTAKVSAGIQINSTTAFSVALSPDLVALAATDPTDADNSYYTFIPGVQPPYDMSVTSITTNAYLAAGNASITGKIRNLGSSTITSLTMNYKIDGGAAVSAPLTGLSIAPLATYTFTHPTPWNATIGSHTVQTYATLLNGSNADQNPGDDSKTKSISVLSETVQRLPLLEVFTSSTCPPCTPGNINFHSIVDPKPQGDFVAIKYQQDFPGTGDPYCTTESVNRRTTPYAINSIPRMEIDGFWDGNASSFTQQLYDDARAIPAQYKMSGTYSTNNMTVSSKVKFSPLFNATGAKLYVAILEKETIKNIKSNGETKFYQVMKKMLPSEVGTSLPTVTIGNWDSLSFNYTFNGNYRLPADGQSANRINHAIENSIENTHNLYVIAWIQASDKTVFQACNLTSLNPVGVENVSQQLQEVLVYPNPSSDVLHVNFKSAESNTILYTLVNTTGSVILSSSKEISAGSNSFELSTKGLANGMYHLMLFDSKNNSHVEQVLVQH